MTKKPSFLSFFKLISEKYLSQPALVIRSRVRRQVISYQEFSELLVKGEALFSQKKVNLNDKVFIWSMNNPAYAVVLASCFAFRRVAVPVDFRMSPELLQKIIDQTKPKIAFVSKFLDYRIFEKNQIPMIFLEDFFDELAHISTTQTLKKLAKNPAYTRGDATAEIVYTSGTTGLPKGVVLTHRALLTNVDQVLAHIPNFSNGRIISILPLSHVFEQVIGFLLPLHFGATIFYVNRLNSYRLLQAFQEYRPTHQIFVPQLLKLLWNRIEEKAKQQGRFTKLQQGLSVAGYLPLFLRRQLFREIHTLLGGQLQVIASGGAPLDKDIAHKWQALGLQVIEGYGATEISAAATMNSYHSPKLGTVGKPVKDVQIHLNEEGEIFIQTPALSQGYYRQPRLTKKAFTPQGYRTGDIGYFDREGHLVIKGRDVFKIVLPSGEKVFAEDIEQKAKEDDRIKDICIVGIHHPDGDEIHAYFLLNNEAKPEQLPDIVRDINQTLEAKQNILSFELWVKEDFPRTSTLKIDRKYLQSLVNNRTSKISTPPTPASPYLNTIDDVLAHVTKKPKSEIKEHHLLSQDLGLDSLGRTELVACAEEYLGIMLDETLITHTTTVVDLKALTQKSHEIKPVYMPTWQFTGLGQFLHKVVSQLLVFPLHNHFIKISYPQATLPPIHTPGLIIFNHPGIADVVCINRTLAIQDKHKIVSLTHSEFWNTKPLLTHIFELIGGSIPLYKTGYQFIKAMETVSDLVDQGYSILIAPQGTIQRSSNFDPFLPGIGYLVKEFNLPITMLYIHGYRELWPAKADAIANTKFEDLLPQKRGKVQVFVSSTIVQDWQKWPAEKITAHLEKEYRNFAESNGGKWDKSSPN